MSDQPVLTRACWQPWDSLNIAADGQVYPCCVVHPKLVVGNLQQQSLQEIVAGEAMLQIKRRLLAGDIVGLVCEDCCNAPLEPVEEFKRALRDDLAGETEPAPDVAPAAPEEPAVIAEVVREPATLSLATRLGRILSAALRPAATSR